MQFGLLTIDDLGKLDRGRSRHRPRDDKSLYGGVYPFIQTGEVKHAPFYINSYSQTYNEQGLAQSKLWNPGTLCITIAANIADTAILNIKACFPDSILGFIPFKNKSDVRFIKYCFDIYKTTLEAISKGTTQDNLSLDKLRKVKFRIPSYPIQRKIAAVLSAYDDLIENNNRRIAILEKMAEELYREWFVRLRFPEHENMKITKGIPEGWEVKFLNEYVQFERGFEPGSDEYFEFHDSDKKPFIRVGDMSSKRPTVFISNNHAQSVLKDDDIALSLDGTVGMVKMGLNGYFSSGIRKVIPGKEIPSAYLYHLLESETVQSVIFQHAAGSTILHASSAINYIKFVKPTEQVLTGYARIVMPLMRQISILRNKVTIYETSRIRLLSWLMAGKIDVEKLDIRFPESMREEVAANA